jgi:hypothetical protein
MSTDVTMQELELETAELLPARETLHCGGGYTNVSQNSAGFINVLNGNNVNANVLSGNLSGNGIFGVGGSGNGSIL